MNTMMKQTKVSRTFSVSIAILAALFLTVLLGGGSAKAYPSGAHLYSDAWAGQPSGLLSSPYDAAVDPDTGNVFVLDTGNNRVQQFTANGVYVSQFGIYGTGNGEFIAPRGIDVFAGRVLVADSGNHRVQAFTTAGQFLYSFGGQGSGGNQFQSPQGVSAVQDTDGTLIAIYVADTNNNRISVWIPSGSGNTPPTHLGNIGAVGSANGQFSQPFGVDTRLVENDGSPCGYHAEMVVADFGNQRVQRFDSSNSSSFCIGATLPNGYTTKWAINGQPFKAKFGPGSNNVYTATSVGTPITVNTATGTPVTTWGTAGTGDGQFRFARGLAVSTNQVFVADGNNNRIQRFSLTGTFQTKWGISSNGDGEFDGPNDVARDSTGNIYVLDTNNSRVQKFNSSGRLLTKWGSQGAADGQFNNPFGIAVDANDIVWVADTDNNRIQKFNAAGVFQSKFGTSGNADGQFNGPRDIAFIGANAYVVDGGNNRIQAFNATTNAFITKWGGPGGANGQFAFVNSIAALGGYIYVSDLSRVQGFNFGGGFVSSTTVATPTGLTAATGELLVAQSGTGTILNYLAGSGSLAAPYSVCVTGDGPGELSNPQGLATLDDSTFYVADTGNNRIVKNEISGSHISPGDPTTCETKGALGNSQFTSPRGIAAAANGDIYVADFGAGRIVRYGSNGAALARWGLGDGPEGFSGVNSVAVASNGTVATADLARLRTYDNVGAQQNTLLASPTSDLAAGSGSDIYRLQPTGVTRYNSSLVSQGTWGSAGSGNSQFSNPSGIATDSTGNVYVADTGNNRIQKFSPTGTYISQIATPSPFDVAIGPADERIYALESATAKVRSYTQAGTSIEAFGSVGSGNGQSVNPKGIAVTAAGRVALSDNGNRRVELLNFTNSRTLYDSKITDYGGNELTVPAIPATTVTGGF